MENPLDRYLSENYEAIVEMAKTITRGRHPDYEDLTHMVVEALYKKEASHITQLIERKQLRYWIVRIMLNQYNSSSSPFHYTYRKPSERHRTMHHSILEWSNDGEFNEGTEELLCLIEEGVRNLPYFDRMITMVYYNHRHSLNTLSQQSGISRTTLYKALRRARKALRDHIEETKGPGAGRYD